ncbi:GNAT family N-acetyltransferase [Nonomuraea sp. MCN248]|uniref:GNAT family N-acetyltransferase n=1 Tax=Nonomuraea corallina TaxID=2989783 RepID=A0ABT4S5C0_9ACTN|nr:GNAT family N-acetyltransferase [Nonomuraea corallina]MDA0632398.1 GNAT family N-acetyltransferase [Nonomuraea corallina]
MAQVEVRLLPAAAAGDGALVDELTELVNRVYRAAEEGLWAVEVSRTSTEEMAALIGAGEIAVARLDGRIVGAVRVRRLESGEAEFGMLATDPAHRGAGIGSRLVDFAEQLGRERGAEVMRLELLAPREGRHPFKEYLSRWYTRIGYRLVRVGLLEESYPELAPHLAGACDFRVYHKDLRAHEG